MDFEDIKDKNTADENIMNENTPNEKTMNENIKNINTKKGKVWLVGSGPGGLGLLTFKAREVIDSADVILYDQLPGDEIIESLPESAEKIDVGKFGGNHKVPQSEIEDIIVKKALEGKIVVRLKGGDPFVFGRGGEEMQTIRSHNIEVDFVPGVTSGIAVPESVGIPVTHRDFASSVTLVTGHENPEKEMSSINWEWLAKSSGTVVIYMGVKNLGDAADRLMKFGMNPSTPIAVIENGFRKNQRVTCSVLGNIKEKAKEVNFRPPAVIVIGDVVTLYND